VLPERCSGEEKAGGERSELVFDARVSIDGLVHLIPAHPIFIRCRMYRLQPAHRSCKLGSRDVASVRVLFESNRSFQCGRYTQFQEGCAVASCAS